MYNLNNYFTSKTDFCVCAASLNDLKPYNTIALMHQVMKICTGLCFMLGCLGGQMESKIISQSDAVR